MFALLLLAAAQTPAPAPTPTPDRQFKVSPIEFRRLWDWRADGDTGAWLETYTRKWYHVTTRLRCETLPYATRLGVEARGGVGLDNTGMLLVDGQRCPIETIAPSGPPPHKGKAKG